MTAELAVLYADWSGESADSAQWRGESPLSTEDRRNLLAHLEAFAEREGLYSEQGYWALAQGIWHVLGSEERALGWITRAIERTDDSIASGFVLLSLAGGPPQLWVRNSAWYTPAVNNRLLRAAEQCFLGVLAGQEPSDAMTRLSVEYSKQDDVAPMGGDDQDCLAFYGLVLVGYRNQNWRSLESLLRGSQTSLDEIRLWLTGPFDYGSIKGTWEDIFRDLDTIYAKVLSTDHPGRFEEYFRSELEQDWGGHADALLPDERLELASALSQWGRADADGLRHQDSPAARGLCSVAESMLRRHLYELLTKSRKDDKHSGVLSYLREVLVDSGTSPFVRVELQRVFRGAAEYVSGEFADQLSHFIRIRNTVTHSGASREQVVALRRLLLGGTLGSASNEGMLPRLLTELARG